MYAINFIVHGHMTHSTVSIHLVVKLAAFIVILYHTIVFRAKLIPLHVWIVKPIVIIPRVLLRVVAATIAHIIARARPRMLPSTVNVSTVAVGSEFDFALISGLAHASFGANSWEGDLVLHFVQDEERHGPFARVLIPDTPLAQLVLV